VTGVRVDVLIPVYNAAETLEDSIASIQTQTVTNIRLIVVNDGSSDGTALILHRLAAQDPRITVISTENNGIVDALNTGLEICTAPYLARMDADDLAFPERFAQQIAYLEENRDCIALAGNVWHVDQAGRRTGTRTSFAPEMNADPYWAPSREPYLMHPFLMARTEAVRNVGGYRYVFHAEDTDLYWRLAHDGRLYNLPDLLGEYRLHANSISGASILNGRISPLIRSCRLCRSAVEIGVNRISFSQKNYWRSIRPPRK
jgi:glycosyltransferase involved in cell wall biosynthesis